MLPRIVQSKLREMLSIAAIHSGSPENRNAGDRRLDLGEASAVAPKERHYALNRWHSQSSKMMYPPVEHNSALNVKSTKTRWINGRMTRVSVLR